MSLIRQMILDQRRAIRKRLINAAMGLMCWLVVVWLFWLKSRGEFLESPKDNELGKALVVFLTIAGGSLLGRSLSSTAIKET